jgi:hypothetical protein
MSSYDYRKNVRIDSDGCLALSQDYLEYERVKFSKIVPCIGWGNSTS